MQNVNRVTIKRVRKISCNSKLYDIETAKNHNFFANGMLVHNSSATYYCKLTSEGPVVGICSRSLELKDDCVNNYTRINAKYSILDKLKEVCVGNNRSLAIRGEIYGSGIQGHASNPHAKLPLDFAAFRVLDLDTLRYISDKRDPFHVENLCFALGIPNVPLVETVELSPDVIKKYSSDLNKLDGKPFEGVVVNHISGSFKIINMSYDERK